jgi:putative ABC transport system substrate-binding protein
LTPQRLEQQAAYPTFRETSRLLGYKEGSNLRVLERGFISYTFDPVGLYARTAVVVDRILKGAKPGDLPVEQSTKFESTINLKTAKALGIDIPRPLLSRADRVFE